MASLPQPPPSSGAPLQVVSVAPNRAANRAAASATPVALASAEGGLLSRSVGVVALGPGIGRYDDANSCFDHGWVVTLRTADQPLSGRRRLLCRRVIAVGLGVGRVLAAPLTSMELASWRFAIATGTADVCVGREGPGGGGLSKHSLQ